MRVLLLGEYSGFYSYLKDGLLERGVKVRLIANGDAMCPWKQIDGADDLLFPQDGTGIIKWLNNTLMPYVNAKAWKNYDVVQMVNPVLYPGMINYHLPERIIAQNGRFFLSSAGDDIVLWKAYKKKIFQYFTYDGDQNAGLEYDVSRLRNRCAVAYQKRLIRKAVQIIPCSYDYYKAYTSFKNLAMKTILPIPLPINCDKITYEENKVKRRVIFFHGINRRIAKGTAHIEAALNKLKGRYPNDVEIIINRRMPFSEYVDAMQKTNVVIDQCKTYSYGMNACIAMAQGKVVMSGNHPESYAQSGIVPPVIWIKPDREQIYDALVNILERRNQISEMGLESRCFAESVHNHRTVADQYLRVWSNRGRREK